MWGSVKGRKRCVVVAQGYVTYPLPVSTAVEGTELKHNSIYSRLRGTHRYYEWLKKGSQRTPHFTRHKDQRLMLFAGLYDSVTLEGERRASRKVYLILLMAGGVDAGQSEPLWTFTIVTTASSSSLAWLHDRQPVILTSQDALDRWLDTSTQTWDPKLNRLFGPYNDSVTPLEWCAPSPPIQFPAHTLSTRFRAHTHVCICGVGSQIATPCPKKSAK
jgi:hypothetical protein